MKRPFLLKKIEAAALALLFCAALAAPLAFELTHPALTVDSVEMRKLAAWPRLKSWQSAKSWEKFVTGLEAYFNDHFGLRGALLEVHARVNKLVFQRAPSPDVTQGKDGWLFWNGDDALANYRGLSRLSEPELANWLAVLEARQAWLAARGITYLFVVCPDKQSIYPEHLAAGVTKLRAGTALDQLLAYVSARSRLQILDLRPALQAAKPQGQLYLKQDTHWSALGAFIGYQAIMARLQAGHPELVAMRSPQLQPPQQQAKPGDLGRFYRSSQPYESIAQTSLTINAESLSHFPDGQLPADHQAFMSIQPAQPRTELRALVVRDSFFTRLLPYFTPHFRKTVCVWPRQQLAEADERNLAALVEEEKPQIFIEEVVERLLNQRPPAAADVFGGAGPGSGAVAFPGKSP